MSLASEKEAACAVIDNESKDLRALSLDMWENPETGFQEHHAHQVLTDFLEKKGFQVERRYKLDTAFKATACSKDLDVDSPHVGVMCEYDALPGIGHACGHNLICILALATALGIKEVLDKYGLKGKVTVLGCPAEEGGGGKVDLINADAFDDLDIAMMAHPTESSVPKPKCVALAHFDESGKMNPSLAVDSLRDEFESNTEWNIRRQFLEANKDELPLDRLTCLSRCFVNMAVYECSYPKSVMVEVNHRSKGLLEEIENRRK